SESGPQRVGNSVRIILCTSGSCIRSFNGSINNSGFVTDAAAVKSIGLVALAKFGILLLIAVCVSSFRFMTFKPYSSQQSASLIPLLPELVIMTVFFPAGILPVRFNFVFYLKDAISKMKLSRHNHLP